MGRRSPQQIAVITLVTCSLSFLYGISALNSSASAQPITLPTHSSIELAQDYPDQFARGRQAQTSIGMTGDKSILAADSIDKFDASTSLATESFVVYQSFRDGNWEIYRASGNNAYQTRLTYHVGSDIRPNLSLNGAHVAFASNRDGNYEIYVINADGTGTRRVTQHAATDTNPVWSPDRSQIAFVSDRSGNPEIFVMNADGSNVKQLTFNPASDFQPTWSPDGQSIAWISATSSDSGQLMVMDANGSNQLGLTSSTCRYLSHPSWSPDSAKLAYDCDNTGDDWTELYTIDIRTQQTGRVFDAGTAFIEPWAGSWSPDGQYIAFTLVTYGVFDNQLTVQFTDLAQVGANGSNPYIMSGATRKDVFPSWQWIDYVAPRSVAPPLPAMNAGTDVRVAWLGSDLGRMGLSNFDVQVRIGNGAWSDWLQRTHRTNAIYSGVAGQTIHFRVRARDRGGNLENWRPGSGDVSTLVAAATLKGTVTDSRGVSIPDVSLALSPAPIPQPGVGQTNAFGQFAFGLPSLGTFSFQTQKSGFDQASASQAGADFQGSYDHYMPSPGNVVQNGGFEDAAGGLNAWSTMGEVGVTQGTSSHSGNTAARMGNTPSLGLTDAYTLPISIYNFNIIADSNLNTYLLYLDIPPSGIGGSTRYLKKSSNGTWSFTPVTLMPTSAFHYRAFADQLGGFYVYWLQWGGNAGGSNNYSLLYCYKASNSDACSTAETVATGLPFQLNGAMALDAAGAMHALYIKDFQIYYVYRPVGGAWSAPERVGTNHQSDLIDMAVASGRVHVVWSQVLCTPTCEWTGAQYRAKTIGGTWEAPITLVKQRGSMGTSQRILVDRNGDAYVHVSGSQSSLLRFSTNTQITSASIVVESGVSECQTADIYWHMRLSGVIDLFCRSGQDHVWYSKMPEGIWERKLVIPPPQSPSQPMPFWQAFGVDEAGAVYMLGNNNYAGSPTYLRHSAFADGSTAHSISQQLTVPDSFTSPTLAFMYRTDNRVLPGDHVLVRVNNESGAIATTVVTNTGMGWHLGWADLGLWRGQVVTTTLEWRQKAGNIASALSVDGVSLSDWTTPVPMNVMPNRLLSTGIEITITGLNFAPSSQVFAGNVLLPNVQYIDSSTLKAVTVQALPPGRFDVRVRNADGKESSLPRALLIGHEVALPIVLR